jgi:hypothetical protein
MEGEVGSRCLQHADLEIQLADSCEPRLEANEDVRVLEAAI